MHCLLPKKKKKKHKKPNALPIYQKNKNKNTYKLSFIYNSLALFGFSLFFFSLFFIFIFYFLTNGWGHIIRLKNLLGAVSRQPNPLVLKLDPTKFNSINKITYG